VRAGGQIDIFEAGKSIGIEEEPRLE